MGRLVMTANTVPLLRSPADGEHLDEAPPYVRSHAGTYHHRPRSACRLHMPWDPDEGRLVVHAWCGQSLNRGVLLDEPEGPVCGTCEGRFLGWQRERNLIFGPVDHWGRPAWCPLVNFDTDLCPVCGSKPSHRYSRWYGASRTTHRAGDGITAWAPCEQHGWKWMAERDGTVVCTWWSPHREERHCGYELEERTDAPGDGSEDES